MIAPVRSGKGTLLVLAGLLAASGVIRIGTDVGTAFAANPTGSDTGQDLGVACACDGVPAELTAALLARENRVSSQEMQLSDRMRALAIAEEELVRKIEELKAAEESLASAIAAAETASSNDLARLTAVYENMKPVEAAALFEEMAPNFAAGFIGQMRPDSAAAIMAGLEPTTAYAISVVLAGRNAEVPTE